MTEVARNKAVCTPGAVANYFLKKAWAEEQAITPMQLQKLIYFAQGWYLAKKETLLIDEPIEAWEFGPVCSSVYHEYKKYGRHPIPKGDENLMSELRWENPDLLDPQQLVFQVHEISEGQKEAKDILDEVWRHYSKYDALTLSNMTHKADEKNPWILARQKAREEGIVRGKDISKDDITSYFKALHGIGAY